MDNNSLPRHEAAARFVKATQASWTTALIYLDSPAITDWLSIEFIDQAIADWHRDKYEYER